MGAGQYAKVVVMLEPIPMDQDYMRNDFINDCIGGNIPPNFFPAIAKGWNEACAKGVRTGYPLMGVRFIVNDGEHHVVDSSELAFRLAVMGAVREVWEKGIPTVFEPVMRADVVIPVEYQGDVMAGLAKRHGSIVDSETTTEFATFTLEVPLNNMFGYSTELRTQTQGKGEFSMEYLKHLQAPPQVLDELAKEFEAERLKRLNAK